MEERCWSCPASNAAIRSYVLRCSCTCKEREPKGLGQVLRSFIQPKAWCHTALATHAPKTASAATLRGFFMPRDTWKGKNPWLELLSTDPKPLKNHGLFRVCGMPSNTYSFEVLTTSNPQDSFMPMLPLSQSLVQNHTFPLSEPPWSWTSTAVWQVKSPWATWSHPPQRRRSVSARAKDPKNPPWLRDAMKEGPASSWFEPVLLGSLPNSCFLQKTVISGVC